MDYVMEINFGYVFTDAYSTPVHDPDEGRFRTGKYSFGCSQKIPAFSTDFHSYSFKKVYAFKAILFSFGLVILFT